MEISTPSAASRGPDRNQGPAPSNAVAPEPFWNLPNVLTLSRLPLAAVAWMVRDRPLWFASVIAAAAFTDLIDGPIARFTVQARARRGEPPTTLCTSESPAAWLDPLCDKTFVLTILVALWVTIHPPLVAVLLLATREILQLPLAIAYKLLPAPRGGRRYDFRAAPLGKLTTVAQFVGFGALLLWPAAVMPLAVVVSALGLTTTIYYVLRGLAAAPIDGRTSS